MLQLRIIEMIHSFHLNFELFFKVLSTKRTKLTDNAFKYTQNFNGNSFL
jgi:hypothetical protein